MDSSTSSSAKHAFDWHFSENQAHFDPLLDCLVELTRIHGSPWTHEALAAGLPLVENRLTPSLLPRAAKRAGLSARVLRRNLNEIPDRLLPAVLLLNDQRACLLLERQADGQYKVRFPEGAESVEILSEAELAELYSGIVLIVRPRFSL
ncbi:cysteine peptidase family C39 domain-containing protein [Deefgea sp. CFH1-16]|uniref:cysteine peptidase family C39 domain-containing protein n=1 Tax=Deefgea sp. CFH1-16 TaxID=2675457 RepID=UPI001FFCF120|nr:cysteine peptidase family C39 domain-containing protein [Deefgea sp. CFH1-16]